MTAPLTTAEPLWDLVEESLDEATFLWKRWESELSSLTRNLDEVWSWTEDRLQGALDGVRVAGAGVTRALEPLLTADDPGALTVAAHLLAAAPAPDARTKLAETFANATGPALRALTRGVEVAELDQSFAPVVSVLSARGPEHSAALCRLKAFRRSKPARELPEAFESNVPELQVDALRAVRVAKDPGLLSYVERALASDAPAVRLAGIECGVYLRLPKAWSAAASLARERNPDAGPLLPLLAMLGSAEDHQLVINALREPALQVQGLFALGFVGTPQAVEICISGMKDPKLARAAGEAYSAITGVDLEHARLTAPEPEQESLPELEAEDLDAPLVPAPSDLWPLPDQEAVKRHWASVQSRFRPGARYLRGHLVDMAVLQHVVETGPMLRRPEVIFELGVRTAGQYDVEPRAFAATQRRMMALARQHAGTAAR